MKNIDNDALAMQLSEELLKAGAVSVLIVRENYLTCNDEIVDTTSRRELEAILFRLGVFGPGEHLTKQQAVSLRGLLTFVGIHLDQWLSDRKYQSDLDELNDLLADYEKYRDLSENDTRLRMLILKLAKKHVVELQKALASQPPDSSVHAIRMKQHMTATGLI